MKKIIFIIFIILLSSFVFAIEGNDPNTEAYYSYDSGSLLDSTTNNNDLINNDSTANVTGILNEAYSFDGINDFHEDGDVDVIGDESINVWAKWTSSGDMNIITKFPTSGKYPLQIRQSSTSTVGIYCIVYDGSTAPLAKEGSISSNDDNWHMITCVRDATNNKIMLYIDGVSVNNATDTLVDNLTNDAIRTIGAQTGGSGFFTGSLDEISVWSKDLNSSEVSFLYNSSSPGIDQQFPFVILENLTINQSTYNMTSDGGCTAWRTNTSTNCNTTDGTPTFIFDTNRAANCSVRATQSDSDNFSSFNSSFECSTTGEISHVCTVYNIDKLLFEFNYLYASCSDGGNATSGALAINMTAGSGDGLVDCISVVGAGCAAVISDSCAAIIK